MGKQVECYSGAKYAERPTVLIWENRHLAIEAIERQWQEPSGPAFRVRTADGQRFELHYDERADIWAIRLLTDFAN